MSDGQLKITQVRSTIGSRWKQRESLRTLGYAVVDGGYSASELAAFSQGFDSARRAAHGAAGGTEVLARIDEHNTIRTPFAYDRSLLTLARNPAILEICKRLIGGYQILSQQNGVINPPARTYNQGAWHRDLPYQHVVFSRPMAINALFCLDAFTAENGATMVLPATHKQEEFPSDLDWQLRPDGLRNRRHYGCARAR